jgi:RimJ/RimL family protein N-acetyltransferase
VSGGAGIGLAPLDRTYLDTVRSWIADPELRDLVGTTTYPSEAEHEHWHARITTDPTRFTAVVVDGDEPKGLVGLIAIDHVHQKAELWLYVGQAADRHKGIGKAAVRQALAHAFGTLGLHRVYVHVFGFNHGAHAFFAATGFRDEGVERGAVFKRGQFHDVWIMGVLAQEFHGA